MLRLAISCAPSSSPVCPTLRNMPVSGGRANAHGILTEVLPSRRLWEEGTRSTDRLHSVDSAGRRDRLPGRRKRGHQPPPFIDEVQQCEPDSIEALGVL